MLLGSFLTILVAHFYYVRASHKLIKEASELKHLNTLMLRGLESMGEVELARDNNGNITGMLVKGVGHLQASPSTINGIGTVTPKDRN